MSTTSNVHGIANTHSDKFVEEDPTKVGIGLDVEAEDTTSASGCELDEVQDALCLQSQLDFLDIVFILNVYEHACDVCPKDLRYDISELSDQSYSYRFRTNE
jgi:hypothetical protein